MIVLNMNNLRKILIFVFLVLTSAAQAWNPFAPVQRCKAPEPDYFIVFLVDAPHLHYRDNNTLLKTIAKHPSNGSKNGDVGHAWIYMQGIQNGQRVFIEGGHSGELGIAQAKYFDGIMNYIEYGFSNPTPQQKMCPRYEPNPIKYLWEQQNDGFFQTGSGKHTPTYAAKIAITPEQFQRVMDFLQPDNYCYSNYALTDHQCSTFVSQVGDLLNFPIYSQMTINIDRYLTFGGETFCLWEDPRYAMLTFASPDVIECSLKLAVNEGRAQYAMPWYERTHAKTLDDHMRDLEESVILFPGRFKRFLLAQ